MERYHYQLFTIKVSLAGAKAGVQIKLFIIMNNKKLKSENIELQSFWHNFIRCKHLLIDRILIFIFMLNYTHFSIFD